MPAPTVIAIVAAAITMAAPRGVVARATAVFSRRSNFVSLGISGGFTLSGSIVASDDSFLVRIVDQVEYQRPLWLDDRAAGALAIAKYDLHRSPFDRHRPAVGTVVDDVISSGRRAVPEEERRGIDPVDRARRRWESPWPRRSGGSTSTSPHWWLNGVWRGLQS
jgi:hypothetical protein